MKIVLQRVTNASVEVEGKIVGSIQKGYVVYLGVAKYSTKKMAEKLVEKIVKLRIFADENGKTNLSSLDVGGEVLIISQFTLNADLSSNRPSFSNNANVDLAKEIYEYFIDLCKTRFKKTETGQFGAHMQVQSHGDGPFTLVLEEMG